MLIFVLGKAVFVADILCVLFIDGKDIAINLPSVWRYADYVHLHTW
jgi:hypothetical protein